MVNTECHNSIVIDNSSGAPAGGLGGCELVDLDDDIAVYIGEIVVSERGIAYEGKLSSVQVSIKLRSVESLLGWLLRE